MKVKKKQIESFSLLYKKKFKVELTYEESLEASTKLITLCKDILLPNFSDDEKIKKH